MRKYKVIHRRGGVACDGKIFDALDSAERYYRGLEPGHMGVVEFWTYDPPYRVVFGHTAAGEWRFIKSKEGCEEFA
jgi:hypothetical protein